MTNTTSAAANEDFTPDLLSDAAVTANTDVEGPDDDAESVGNTTNCGPGSAATTTATDKTPGNSSNARLAATILTKSYDDASLRAQVTFSSFGSVDALTFAATHNTGALDSNTAMSSTTSDVTNNNNAFGLVFPAPASNNTTLLAWAALQVTSETANLSEESESTFSLAPKLRTTPCGDMIFAFSWWFLTKTAGQRTHFSHSTREAVATTLPLPAATIL